MTTHVELRRGAYADSVTLLQVSRTVQGVDGVAAAQVAMATALNVEVLTEMGFEVPAEATPNDMVVAVRLADGGSPRRRAGRRGAGAGRVRPPRQRAERGGAAADHGRGVPPLAGRGGPDAIALVSVPGAARLRRGDGRRRGRPRRDDLQRQRAGRAGGRAQAGRRRAGAAGDGPGLRYGGRRRPRARASPTSSSPARSVSSPPPAPAASRCWRCSTTPASGSPTRWASVAATCPPRSAGWRPARRCGGWTRTRRRADRAGLQAARARGARPRSRTTPPSLGTPVELALLGAGHPDLTEATEAVLRRLGREVPAWPVVGLGRGAVRRPLPARAVRRRHPGERGEDHRDRAARRQDAGHTFVDFGDDAYTTGRAHPMIDPTLRLEHLARAAADPDTAVLLLDVVLGHGAEPDPAALLAPALSGVRQPVVVVGRRHRRPTRRGWTARSGRSPTPAPRCTCPTRGPPGAPSSCCRREAPS